MAAGPPPEHAAAARSRNRSEESNMSERPPEAPPGDQAPTPPGSTPTEPLPPSPGAAPAQPPPGGTATQALPPPPGPASRPPPPHAAAPRRPLGGAGAEGGAAADPAHRPPDYRRRGRRDRRLPGAGALAGPDRVRGAGPLRWVRRPRLPDRLAAGPAGRDRPVARRRRPAAPAQRVPRLPRRGPAPAGRGHPGP